LIEFNTFFNILIKLFGNCCWLKFTLPTPSRFLNFFFRRHVFLCLKRWCKFFFLETIILEVIAFQILWFYVYAHARNATWLPRAAPITNFNYFFLRILTILGHSQFCPSERVTPLGDSVQQNAIFLTLWPTLGGVV